MTTAIMATHSTSQEDKDSQCKVVKDDNQNIAEDRTPRPEDYQANGHNDESREEESPYIDKKQHTSRRGRLSIDNLVRHSSSATRETSSNNMNVPAFNDVSAASTAPVHSATDFDSLAVLTDASHHADMSAGYLSLGDVGPQHSMSSEPEPSVRYGRTRSGTVRRYPSSNSASSAPPQLGDLGGLPGEAYRGSAHASPFLGSGSASDSASTQGSPHYLRSALQGQSQSPHLGTSTSWSGTTPSSQSLSRSPPTQHNRKKRNKCSPEQYRQLEAFFANNRNPTGKIREELSKRITMPERSVQVWFQNKRAKTKLNEIKEGIPPEQRTTVSRPKIQRTASATEKKRKSSEAIENSPTQEESVIQLPATSLCVGEWRRIKPLICLFSRRNQCFTWYLSSESVGFKLESPRANIKSVTFVGPRTPTLHEFGEGINTELGHLVVELERPPQFYMEVFRSSGHEKEDSVQRASWRQCSDFTEGKQATNVLTHIVCGPFAHLRASAIMLQQTGIAPLVSFQDNVQTTEWQTPTTSVEAAWAPAFTPQSANLDMSGLNLNSAMSSTFDTGMPGAQPQYTWPQTAGVQSSWAFGSDRYAHHSGAASAPPYQAQGFEQQQQHHQQQQQQFASNPMGGI